MRSRDVVELNCGLGTAGLGAAAKGARVRLMDANEEALDFARYNSLQNGFTHITTHCLDWRTERLNGHVGSLVMADVLHDDAHYDQIFRILHDNLSPGHTAFLAEPGRVNGTAFFEELRKTKFRVRLDMERVHDLNNDNYYLVSILRLKKND